MPPEGSTAGHRNGTDILGGGAGNRIGGGATEKDPRGANGVVESEAILRFGADRVLSELVKDDCGTIPATPRGTLILALAIAVRDGVGDWDAMLVKLAARLLADLTEPGAAMIVEVENRASMRTPVRCTVSPASVADWARQKRLR